MPWELKRWIVFTLLMFAAAVLALNYRPEGAVAPTQDEFEADKPTIPLERPGPGETPEPSPPPSRVTTHGDAGTTQVAPASPASD